MANTPYSPVPTQEPQAGLPDTFQKPNINAEQFGVGPIRGRLAEDQALHQFGGQVMEFGKVLGETAADDQANKYQEKIEKILNGGDDMVGPDGKPLPGGYLGMTGQQAMDARPWVQGQMQAARDELRGGLQTGDQQKRFDAEIRRQKAISDDKIGRHYNESTKQYAVHTAIAQQDMAVQEIARNFDNPVAYEAATHRLTDALVKQAQLHGGGPDAIQAAIMIGEKRALLTRVDAMAVKNPGGAQALLDQNRMVAGDKYDEASNKLRARAEAEGAITGGNAIYDAAPSGVPGAPAAPGAAPTGTVSAETQSAIDNLKAEAKAAGLPVPADANISKYRPPTGSGQARGRQASLHGHGQAFDWPVAPGMSQQQLEATFDLIAKQPGVSQIGFEGDHFHVGTGRIGARAPIFGPNRTDMAGAPDWFVTKANAWLKTKGGEPRSETDQALANVVKQYPSLGGYNWNVIDSRKKGVTDRQLEFYPPNERDNPTPGRPTLEIFRPDLKGPALEKAIYGDMLHHLPAVDEQYAGMRKRLLDSLTPEQIAVDQRAYDNAKKEGEERGFWQWMEESRLDAYVRGKLAPDERDEWRNVYTPEQTKILAEMQMHVARGGEGPPAPVRPPPTGQSEGEILAAQKVLGVERKLQSANATLATSGLSPQQQHAMAQVIHNRAIVDKGVILAEEAVRKAKVGHAADEYVNQAAKQWTPDLNAKMMADPHIPGSSKPHLQKLMLEAAGKESEANLGTGFHDVQTRMLLPYGDKRKITSPEELIRLAADGVVSRAGLRELLSNYHQMHGGEEQHAMLRQENRMTAYAKRKLSYKGGVEGDEDYIGIKDERGLELFNGPFMEKFDKGFRKWTQDEKNNPMDYLTTQKMDELITGMRSEREIAEARLRANEVTGQSWTPEQRANQVVPRPPAGVEPSGWNSLVRDPARVEGSGRQQGMMVPLSYATWGAALEKLKRNPTPEMRKAWDDKFGHDHRYTSDHVLRLLTPPTPEQTQHYENLLRGLTQQTF